MKKHLPSSIDSVSTVIDNVEVGPDIFLLTLKTKDHLNSVIPGQFAMIKVGSATSDDPLLRRPLSIHNITEGKLQFLYKIMGRGTEILSTKIQGDTLTVLAPLGTGYTVDKEKISYLVGGGMGIAPLLYLAKLLNQKTLQDRFTVFLGARNKSELLAEKQFRQLSKADIQIATDDGSAGHFGFVTDLLESLEGPGDKPDVYCCGPEPMMKKVADICARRQWNCQVSLEAIMACGMGACLGCAVRKANSPMESSYLHVCSDGPVFNAERIWQLK